MLANVRMCLVDVLRGTSVQRDVFYCRIRPPPSLHTLISSAEKRAPGGRAVKGCCACARWPEGSASDNGSAPVRRIASWSGEGDRSTPLCTVLVPVSPLVASSAFRLGHRPQLCTRRDCAVRAGGQSECNAYNSRRVSFLSPTVPLCSRRPASLRRRYKRPEEAR